MELYAAYFYEQSANAKFLTLIMVLETLTVSHPKHEVALELLTQWRSQVEERKRQLHPGSEEHEALEALERELLFRREASLRSQIRTLVRNTLTTAGNLNASRYAQHAVRAYDRRSTLVHEGTLPTGVLREAARDAREIVEAVLKAEFGSAGSRSVENT